MESSQHLPPRFPRLQASPSSLLFLYKQRKEVGRVDKAVRWWDLLKSDGCQSTIGASIAEDGAIFKRAHKLKVRTSCKENIIVIRLHWEIGNFGIFSVSSSSFFFSANNSFAVSSKAASSFSPQATNQMLIFTYASDSDTTRFESKHAPSNWKERRYHHHSSRQTFTDIPRLQN